MASKISTTLRIDPQLKRRITALAKREGLSFSQIATIAFRALADGFMHISIGVSQYPKEYLETLERESDETMRLYREGKIKGYTSGKSMLQDILGDDYVA